jgi:hypothetical protein
MTNSTRIGFTGTRNGMTPEQLLGFTNTVKAFDLKEFHHGDCIGSDAEAHYHILGLFPHAKIIIHPPDKNGMRAFCKPSTHIHTPLPFLRRNQEIVDETDVLIATPGEATEQVRSGTWSTVRYALKNGRFVLIVYPDGTSRTRAPL